MKKAYLSPVLLLVLMAGLVAGCAGTQAPVTPSAVAISTSTPSTAAQQEAVAASADDRVEALLAQMTLAVMNRISPKDVTHYFIGSVLSGKLPYTWPRSADQLPFDFSALPAEGRMRRCSRPVLGCKQRISSRWWAA